MVVIASREFYRKSIQYSCKAKEILTAQDRSLDGQKLGWKRQKNASVAAQAVEA